MRRRALLLAPAAALALPRIARAFPDRTITLATGPVVLVARNGLARDWAGVAAAARARPGGLTYASAGNGSLPHVSFELLKLRSGIDVLHVPYRGGGPAAQALIAGEVQLNFGDTTTALMMTQSGNVRALAVTGGEPSPQFPGLPTLEQAGLRGFRSHTAYALLAPAGTTQPILDRLQAEIAAWMAIPERRDWLRAGGFVPMASTAEQYRQARAAESAMWGEIIRTRNIRMPS